MYAAVALTVPRVAAWVPVCAARCVDRQVETAMKGLKDDPEMSGIFEELEAGGPAAMMK